MDELRSKLFWHYLPNCSNRVLLRMQDAFGQLPNPLELISEHRNWMPEPLLQLVDAHIRPPNSHIQDRIDKAEKFILDHGVQLIERGTLKYPELLAEIPDPPALLYVSGSAEELARPQIAVVGSRSCSRTGKQDAHHFSRCLAQSGFGITSGLAVGIDTAAHRGALEVSGTTLAVIGTGLDVIYPAGNLQLAKQIVESGGALISEFPPGTPARKEHFPQRNRIISGLSAASLIVEASHRSGSLITARMALEQGRDVLVIPGSIHDPLKTGCHRLIRDGATLVTCVDELIEQIGSLLGFQLESLQSGGSGHQLPQISERQRQVLNHVQFDPIAMDDLLELCQMPVPEVVEILTDLQMEGLLTSGPEGIKRVS